MLTKPRVLSLLLGGVITLTLVSCNKQTDDHDATTSQETTAAAPASSSNDAIIEERLRRFDSLDFQFYSNQQWDSFAVSHSKDIVVYYPDGTKTTGLYPQHIDMLTPLFKFAPDTKITAHPIRLGSGDWTAVVGEMSGTFTKPLDMGNGKVIQPTGKKFNLRMATFGKWNGNTMSEEHLFWDNAALMQQIGVM